VADQPLSDITEIFKIVHIYAKNKLILNTALLKKSPFLDLLSYQGDFLEKTVIKVT
jgi:hypothetical protein